MSVVVNAGALCMQVCYRHKITMWSLLLLMLVTRNTRIRSDTWLILICDDVVVVVVVRSS